MTEKAPTGRLQQSVRLGTASRQKKSPPTSDVDLTPKLETEGVLKQLILSTTAQQSTTTFSDSAFMH